MRLHIKDAATWGAILTLAMVVTLLWFRKSPENTISAGTEVQRGSRETPDLLPPEVIYFAGERCPIERTDIAERLDREIQINKFWKSNTYLLLKRLNRWFPKIEKILKQHGLPEDLKYLAVAETMLQNLESPAGAAGFWQLMPETARELGLEVNEEVDERYDPIKATHAAAKYLKRAKKRFNSWTDVAASYNRGMNGYQRALDKQKVDNFYDLRLNPETARYVFRVLALKEIIENPKKHGFKLDRKYVYPKVKTYTMPVDSTIPDMVAFAHHHGVTYKTLRVHNPWIIDYRLTNPNGKRYIFIMPKQKDYDPTSPTDTLRLQGDSTLVDISAEDTIEELLDESMYEDDDE